MMAILQSLRLFLMFTLVTGVIYPVGITFLARLLFPHEATGSIIERGNQPVGSVLLAQKFDSPRYFQPRPSASAFGTMPSGPSNLGPTSRTLKEAVQERMTSLRTINAPASDTPIPPDLVFASGSGLDPHISPEAMLFQMDRVTKARGFTAGQRIRFETIATGMIEDPQFWFLGESRVNVLLLNLVLDAL